MLVSAAVHGRGIRAGCAGIAGFGRSDVPQNDSGVCPHLATIDTQSPQRLRNLGGYNEHEASSVPKGQVAGLHFVKDQPMTTIDGAQAEDSRLAPPLKERGEHGLSFFGDMHTGLLSKLNRKAAVLVAVDGCTSPGLPPGQEDLAAYLPTTSDGERLVAAARRLPVGEAGAAVHRPVIPRLERDLGLLAALGADSRVHRA